MNFNRGEQTSRAYEPQPLGAEIEPKSAALYEEFASSVEHRSLDEVYKLWKDLSVTNPTIRQRAVTVLTAPDGYELPYSHPDQSLSRVLDIDEKIDGQTTHSLRRRLTDKPQLAKELAAGLIYWLDTTSGRIEGADLDSRHVYFEAIRQLLPIVDEEIADKLFAHYPQPYEDMESEPDRQSLKNLLYDPGIPQRYKYIALAKLFNIAEQEVQAVSQLSEKHEKAIDTLVDIAHGWIYDKDIDNDVYVVIIEFLESHIPVKNMYMRGYEVRRVAERINDEDIRFSFAWRHVFTGPTTDWDNFRIEDDRDLSFVEWMRAEAQVRNLPQFNAKANVLEQAYATKQQKQAIADARERDLQARLRTK